MLLLVMILASTSCLFQIVDRPPAEEIILKSVHGRYITAKGEDDEWVLKQEAEFNDCARFSQEHLANGKIALLTCENRYVTAPETGSLREDWVLGQESKLGNCGQFDRYDLGGERIALKTCAGNFFTAGDGNWPDGLEWSIVAERDYMDAWEIFTVQ
jgi:hypothetical protein